MSAGTRESVPKPDCHSTSDGRTDTGTDQSPSVKLEGQGVVGRFRRYLGVARCVPRSLRNGGLLCSWMISHPDVDDGKMKGISEFADIKLETAARRISVNLLSAGAHWMSFVSHANR